MTTLPHIKLPLHSSFFFNSCFFLIKFKAYKNNHEKISNKLKSVFKNGKLIIQNVEESCSQCHGNDVIKYGLY